MAYPLSEIAQLIHAEIVGDPTITITGIATLYNAQSTAGKGDITFLQQAKYRPFLAETKAAAVILREADSPLSPVTALVVSDPYLAYAKVAQLFLKPLPLTSGIHESAIIHPSANIDANVSIGAYCIVGENVTIAKGVVIHPNCYIGAETVIGADTLIYPGVKIMHHVMIGERCVIQSGTVIGSDGFGFAKHHKRWIKIPQLGRVRIGNDVEIGANTTIDRGALEDTVIEDNVKLDNLIQIAHGVQIGESTAMAACTGVAGSAKIGKHCMIGGMSAINGHIQIADNVVLTGTAGVISSIEDPGIYSSGTGLLPNKAWLKSIVHFRKLDEMMRLIKKMEKEIQVLKKDEHQ